MVLNPCVMPRLNAMRAGLSAGNLPKDQLVLADELLDRLEALHQQGRLTDSVVLLTIESLIDIPEVEEHVTLLSNHLLKHRPQ